VPKSKIKSRAHYTPQPTWGQKPQLADMERNYASVTLSSNGVTKRPRVTQHVDAMPVVGAFKYQHAEVAIVTPPRHDVATSDSHHRLTTQPVTQISLGYYRRHVTNRYTCAYITKNFVQHWADQPL